ncbi:MAG: Na/Pi symporter [Planctomycetes bacterium]|nr:Na/Pi symporter [Planctomycetota bacterium]
MQEKQTQSSFLKNLLIAVMAMVLVYSLILSVGMVGTGFKWSSGGKEGAKALFEFATNPVIGLLMGVFATALVQSSSTVTSVVVGLVAGGMPVSIAVPMIMGANIGTTVTNTLVSLAHMTRPQEFRRAFAAATVHDFFNLMAVCIFLPLEIFTGMIFGGGGLLERVSLPLSQFVYGTGESSGFNIKNLNFIKPLTKPVIKIFHNDGQGLFDSMSDVVGGITLILIGLVLIFISIVYLGKLLRANLTGRAEKIFHTALGRGPVTGLLAGTIITIIVQSSSTTTSLIIPMAGAGLMTLRQVFPFTLGANIGTTVTAFLASLAGGKYGQAAVQIAIVHLLFNLLATSIIYPVPFLRNIPLIFSERLADLAIKSRTVAIGYILFVFFGVPLLVLGVMELL